MAKCEPMDLGSHSLTYLKGDCMVYQNISFCGSGKKFAGSLPRVVAFHEWRLRTAAKIADNQDIFDWGDKSMAKAVLLNEERRLEMEENLPLKEWQSRFKIGERRQGSSHESKGKWWFLCCFSYRENASKHNLPYTKIRSYGNTPAFTPASSWKDRGAAEKVLRQFQNDNPHMKNYRVVEYKDIKRELIPIHSHRLFSNLHAQV